MKKTIISIALCVLSALTFVACQLEITPEIKRGDDLKELTFHVKTMETKTLVNNDGAGNYSTIWKNGDVLGAFLSGTTIGSSTTAVDMTLTNGAADAATGDFTGTAVAAGTGTFQAFYPASAFVKGYASGGIGLEIGTTSDYIQHPTVGAPDPSCDILVSKACEYISDGSDVVIDDLFFTRPLSILKINLKGSYADGEEVNWLKFAVSAGTLSGRVDINLATPEINTWTSAKSYAWAEYSSSKPVINNANDATNNTVFLVVNPTTISAGTTVTITGETAHVTINKSFSLPEAISFPAGGITVINLTINAADCAIKEIKNYSLVTADAAFEDGAQYVFAFKDGSDGHYEFIKNGANSSNIESGALTVIAGVIAGPNSSYVFTAETGEADGSFKFKNSSDNYICNTSSSTVNTNNATGSDWIPTFIIASSTYNLSTPADRYLGSGGGTSARAYLNSNFKDQVKDGTAIAQYAGAISVFKYLDSRSALSTPTGLDVSTKTVSWTAVANAGSYTVTIGANSYVTVTNSYTYSGSDGYFDVSVVAHPSISGSATYKDSDAAELSKATFGTPTLVTPVLSSGGYTGTSITVTWTDDPNASAGYHCEIYNGLSKVSETDVDKGVESVTFSGLTKGTEYTIKVNAKAVTGTYPWIASDVASINMTPDGQTVSSVTAAGSYNIPDLTVMAINGNNVILADATGAILLFKSSHGLNVGDVRTVNGYTKVYHGVFEFYTDGSHDLSITGSTSTTPAYPSPVTYDASKITSYASSPVVEYATATGIANSEARTITVADGKVLNVFGSLASVDGRTVSVNGYAFGYNSSKVDFMLVGEPTIDESVSYLATSPVAGSTLVWADDEYGVGEAKTISVTLNGDASGYTVSSGNAAWTVSNNGSGTITVYPNAANTSTTDDKTLDITITHNDNALLTSSITLKQNKQTGGGATPQTVFLEDFGSTSSNTAFGSYSGYSATTSMFTTSGEVKSHYSGEGKVGRNDIAAANLSSGYTGASGLSGCYHSGVKDTEKIIIQISDINISGCTDLSLSFGALGGSNSHKVNVSYKIDGGSEKSLISNGSLKSSGWTLLSEDIPETGSSLTLIFKHTPGNTWMIRMDDIKVVGTK